MNARLKTLFITIVALLLVSVVLLSSELFWIYKNKTAIHENILNVQNAENKNAQAKRVSTILQQSDEPVFILRSYLVPEADIVGVVEMMEKIGEKTGVSIAISSLSADDSTGLPVGTVNKIKARIDGKGEWNDILVFLTLLESMPHKVALSNISLRRIEGTEKGKLPQWNISLQVEILKIK